MSYLDLITIYREKNLIHLKSPAKINLFLRILDKRKDGYHNLENLMQTINFCDEIEIAQKSVNDENIIFECNEKNVPFGKENIAVRAVMKYREITGIKNKVFLKLKKRIPVGGGLGGGSSNAGTVLLGLNILNNNSLSIKKLTRVAIELGSDVPFFLHGGLALCTGKGEVVTPMKSMELFHIVLVNPGFSISTKTAYENFEKKQLTRVNESAKVLKCGSITYFKELIPVLHNDLEESVITQYPLLREIKDYLEKCGCEKAMVTGSGSSIYGICKEHNKAEEISTDLRSRFGSRFLIITASNRV